MFESVGGVIEVGGSRVYVTVIFFDVDAIGAAVEEEVIVDNVGWRRN